MTARMYKLIEIHQRIDERLRLEYARRTPNRFELKRLAGMKQRAKGLLAKLMPATAAA